MNRAFVILIRQILFWLYFFLIARIVFVIFYFPFIKTDGFSVLKALFYYNFLLDISAICYILAIPLVLLMFGLFVKSSEWLIKSIYFFNITMIVVCSVIVVAEIGVYREWQTKLTYKALAYLIHPSEVFNSAGTSKFLLLLVALFILITVSVFSYKKFVHKKLPNERPSVLFSIIFIVLMPLFFLIGLRGGLQQIPINQSQSYFSKNNNLNLLSVNPFWNFIHSIYQNFGSLEENPFIFYSKEEAKKVTHNANELRSDTIYSILTNNRPNIIMVILEGWSADLVKALGGRSGITPNFDTLVKNGLLFTKIYSPGSRSEQGMSSLFSAFPAHPITAISHMPDKFVKLPSFPVKLKDAGYYTSYYFGGQLIYGNMKGYIYYNRFDRITEGSDFSSDIPRGKLGVHDEFLYPRVISEIGLDKQPFFTSLFTASTHSPYDYPGKKDILHFGDPEREYVNAAYYADSCLGSFVRLCSKEKWFKNSLFIFVSDHGHSSYHIRNVYNPDYQHIPLLFYGPALKYEYQGKQDTVIGSQIDLAATLLHQLKIPSKEFFWSKNLLNPNNPQFAFISYEVGFTWVCKDGYFVYDHNQKTIIENTLPLPKQDSVIKIGKSYLQHLYQEYWDY